MSDWFARPILCVADVASATTFYTKKLAFKESWRHVEDGEPLVVQVERAGCDLILSAQWPERVGKALIFISLDPPALEAARAEFEANGVDIKDGRWGYRLMIIDDLDGNQLLFNYPADADAQPPEGR